MPSATKKPAAAGATIAAKAKDKKAPPALPASRTIAGGGY